MKEGDSRPECEKQVAGENRCEECDIEVAAGQKSQKSVLLRAMSVRLITSFQRARVEMGRRRMGQTLCRDCNIDKSDKLPPQ